MSGKEKNASRRLVTTRAQDVDARVRLVLVLTRSMARAAVFLRPPEIQALATELHREGVCLRGWAEKALDAERARAPREASAS